MPIVKLGDFEVDFFIAQNHPQPDGIYLPLIDYYQNDGHSCGFIATLTVVSFFLPDITPKRLIKLVGPAVDGITERKQIVDALNLLGITARLRKDLTVDDLKYHVRHNTPVILTVWPNEYQIDHWVTVKGFNSNWSKVYLTNHPTLSIKEFIRQWFEWYSKNNEGWGLVCNKE